MIQDKGVYLFSALCISTALVIFLVHHLEIRNNNDSDMKEDDLVIQNVSQGCSSLLVLGDGICDDEFNTAVCNYDLNDCCDPNASRISCQDCFCHATPKVNSSWSCSRQVSSQLTINYIETGDGFCNDRLNTMEYFFDAGDCCLEHDPVSQVFCIVCLCIESTMNCIQDQVGDGYCQDYNNTPQCNYDGGDCCAQDKNEEQCCWCLCREL